MLGWLMALLPFATCVRAADDYTLGPDSMPQAGVPKGQVLGPLELKSRIFENTVRQYWIYVPAQYDAARPAAVMVFQDGHKYVNTEQEYRVPVVFDNLIHKKEMPVTIGIFVNPGHAGTELPADPWRASNRSNEYDTLSEQYARFLLEEILPEVGKTYRLATDPEARAIVGVSSGGICAFTVAWERPDAFRKVLSHIGSFTNIRGGHVYPALIRKSAPRPMRDLPAGRLQRPRQPARQLAPRQPGDGRRPQVPRLRLPLRVRRRRAQRQARGLPAARIAPLALAGLPEVARPGCPVAMMNSFAVGAAVIPATAADSHCPLASPRCRRSSCGQHPSRSARGSSAPSPPLAAS